MRKTFILIVSCLSLFVQAQDSCACCTEFYEQFDFWEGDWIVYDTSGKVIGENLIEKMESNCILNEHWIGTGGTTGSSYNYFDNTDSTWNQLWIDNQGNNLRLKGKFENGTMVLRSKKMIGKKVLFYYNQITWTPKLDGTVTQQWDIIGMDDSILTTIFIGIYKRKFQE